MAPIICLLRQCAAAYVCTHATRLTQLPCPCLATACHQGSACDEWRPSCCPASAMLQHTGWPTTLTAGLGVSVVQLKLSRPCCSKCALCAETAHVRRTMQMCWQDYICRMNLCLATLPSELNSTPMHLTSTGVLRKPLILTGAGVCMFCIIALPIST